MAGQDEAFAAAMLAGADGGYVPTYPPAAPIGVPPQVQADREARFRAAIEGSVPSPVRALAPYGGGIELGVKAMGALANPIGTAIGVGQGMAQPGVPTRLGQVALGLPHDRPEPTITRTHDAEPSDVRPMNTPSADVAPAPTLASQSPTHVPIYGGGGGGGFGGLEKNLRDAHGRQLQGLADAGDLERELGIDQALKAQGMSDAYAANAARMQRDAEDQQRVDALTMQKHDAFLARQEVLANDIAKQQVDPSRLVRNADIGDQMIIGLGAALGGVFGNGHNDYLDRLDKLVDRDINAQLQDIDSKKASFGARQSLFGQMMAETGDRRLAAMQTRKLIYDAAEQKIKSDSERLGIPVLKDNAAIIAQTFAQKRAELDTAINTTALQQAKAAAAAAVAAQRAAEERLYQHAKDAEHLKLEYYKADAANAGKGAAAAKDQGERQVVIDGQDALAVNKKAAEDWGNYTHGRAVVADMLTKLKAAREAGNVGEYDAARGLLIEEVPKLLGYARGPSMGQIKETLGPEVVPKYNHWYNHGSGPIGYSIEQGRSAEKLRVLEDLLATSDRAVREQTFGAKVGAAPAAPRFTPTAAKAPVK